MRAQLETALQRIRDLDAQLNETRAQLREVVKHDELQGQDLERLRDLYERTRPNCPERAPSHEAQLAFERVIETFADTISANDTTKNEDASERKAATEEKPAGAVGKKLGAQEETAKRRHRHGRRKLDLTKLPVETVELEPPEVTATGGEGFIRIGQEISDRLAHRPASYFRLRLVRGKWIAASASDDSSVPQGSADSGDASDVLQSPEGSATPTIADEVSPVRIAPLPDSVWPGVMADPSAVAQCIVSKYDDVTPLNRQERISVRQGFALPRSTQCGWLSIAYSLVERIVTAMFDDARRRALLIATDATGAPVRIKGGSVKWHVFVFVADHDHVVFGYNEKHDGDTVQAFLKGFHGTLLADAAPIYDVLYREDGITELACWFHARRYFWKALETDRTLAMEALAIIAKLFEIDAACRDIQMPVRTAVRAARAGPILELLDAWIDKHREQVDPRGPLHKAIGYYENQRVALHRFLKDGQRPLDNGVSERALRNLVLGRHNWGPFANETGLKWYTTFRSLIASCALHGLNAQEYLEQLLRLAPHWSVTRMLELSPKYWRETVEGLDAHHRAILVRPWEQPVSASDDAGESTPANEIPKVA